MQEKAEISDPIYYLNALGTQSRNTLDTFFSIRETFYNVRGNGVHLCVPKFNPNFMRNSFTYKCAQLWNKIPEDVKLADNVNIWKSKLR